METLEDRAMMAVIPLVSGQATSFRDVDGTQVKVRLIGPGQGTIELMGGVLTGAAIDNLELNGTSGESRLKITTKGGSIFGTTINELVITKALNELGTLKSLRGRNLDFINGGQLTADGNIKDLHVRSLGVAASVDIAGSVDRMKADTLYADASVTVSQTLQQFVANYLASGSEVSADQIDMLKINQHAEGASVNVGAGGLSQANFKNIYHSVISSDGSIGEILVKGDAIGSTVASNIDKGSDGIYGTIDDFVVDRSEAGNIGSVKLRGKVGANGTSQEIDIVASGQTGRIILSRSAQNSGGTPALWEGAASGMIPLSVVQQSANATGLTDDQIWIAVFGQEQGTGSKAGGYFYLDPTNINGGLPTLVTTAGITPGPTTPNTPTLPSFTLDDWKNASQNWGSNLAFPLPRLGNDWTGRILISMGAPVQAQVNADGSIASPSPSNPTDPSTGTFYDFLEFTVTGGATVATSSIDIDTSLVDAFGVPMALQLFEQSPGVTSFTGTLSAGSPTVTAIANTAGLAIGQSVVGEHIPLGATITAITPSTSSVPGSVTLSMNAGPGATGAEPLVAVDWSSFDIQVTGTINPNSNTITGIDSTTLNNLVTNSGLGTSQPIIAVGVLPSGTTIESYVINTGNGTGEITLTQKSLGSVAPNSSVAFTVDPAGPVGVQALRDVITGTGAGSMIDFLKQKIADGNSQARPFLESAAPYLLSGPVQISGVVPTLSNIQVATTVTNVLSASDLVQISGVLGNTVASGVYSLGSVTGSSFTLGYPVSNGVYKSGGNWSVISPALVIGASSSPAVISTSASTALLSNGDTVTVSGVLGNTAVNGTFVANNVTSNSFTLGGPIGNGAYTAGSGYWSLPNAPATTITDCSFAAAPAVISTASTTNLAVNTVVTIDNVVGATNLNGDFVVAAVNADNFMLGGPVGSGTYTSGGKWSVSGGQELAITGATDNNSAIVITTSSTTGLSIGDVVTITGVKGNTAANGSFLVAGVTATTVTLGSPVGQTYTSGGTWQIANGAATTITNATEVGFLIETVNTVGLSSGDLVLISGVNGLTGVNGVFTVANVTANSFTALDATGTGTYVSGGAWQVVQSISGATNNNAPIVITTKTPGLNNGTVVQIGGVEGNTAANGLFVMSGVSGTGFTLSSPAGSGAYISGGSWSGANGGSGSVTSATRGGEVQITTPSATTLTNGDSVVVNGVGGNTAANGTFTVSNVNPAMTTFTLAGTLSNGPYTFGGIFYEAPTAPTTITNATSTGTGPITITTNATSLNNNDIVLITEIEGNTAANGLFVVENASAGSFTLGGPVGNGSFNNNTWSLAVTGASTTDAVISTIATTGLVNGDAVTITGANGNTTINGEFIASNVTGTSFSLAGPVGNGSYTSGGAWSLPNATTTPVLGASNAGPIVIATGNTVGLKNNDWVSISGIAGNTGANGLFQVSNVTATSFTLVGSTGNGAYSSGGAWQIVQPITAAANDGNPIVITSGSTVGIQVGGVVNIQNVGGNTAANGQFVVAAVTSTTFVLGSPAGGGAYTSGASWTSTGGSGSITAATNGGQIVVTASTTAGLQNGDLVEVTGVLGNTAANGVYHISNVTPTSFVLDGATASGTYSFGGTWKEYTSFNRLISPKDLVESLSSPQDTSSLNNYFNEVIDEFFLQYLPSSETLPGGQVGGGQTFSVASSASGKHHTYSGTVTNSGTSNGGYVLRLTSSDPTDTANYDIYYPFFTSNAPSADLYTPLFTMADAPTWITNLGKENESASQMILACDGVFADNTERATLGMPAAQATIVADLENLISGAFNRGIALNAGNTWSDSTQWFPVGGNYNYWVEYWHQTGLTINNLAYAFAYDDKFGASTNLNTANVGLTQITLGSWSSSSTPSSTSLQTSTTLPVAPNGSVTLTANVTGSSPSGTVTFFINGIAINSVNDSNTAPLQPITVTGGAASITANLPSLPGGTYTYSVTAVYSGDATNLPSIGTMMLQVS